MPRRGMTLGQATGGKPGRVAPKSRKQARRANPTPSPAPQDTAAADPGYALQYNPTAEQQLFQPYQDAASVGAMYGLGDAMGRWGQQGQMAGLFGQNAAQNLGQYAGLMGGNQTIQQNLAQQIQDVQAGKADFDPFLTQQFNDQERLLRAQLQRQLGPDYENSSAGIEALGKFAQNKTTTLGSAQFQRLQDLVGMQQGGMQNLGQMGTLYGQTYGNQAGGLFDQAMRMRDAQLGGQRAGLQNTGMIQDLYSNVPRTMGQFGEAMGGMSRYSIAGQEPYQRDRIADFTNYYPSNLSMAGQMLGQTGARWQQAGSMGMGGGGGGMGGG